MKKVQKGNKNLDNRIKRIKLKAKPISEYLECKHNFIEEWHILEFQSGDDIMLVRWIECNKCHLRRRDTLFEREYSGMYRKA